MHDEILKSLGAALLAIAAMAAAPADEAPKPVRDGVAARFPGAEIEKVEKEEEDGQVVYELELRDGEGRIDVEVRADGRILQIETAIKPADLPGPVARLVAARHPGKAVEMAEKVVDFRKGREVTTYEVVIEVDGRKVEIEATPEGKLVDDDEHEERDED